MSDDGKLACATRLWQEGCRGLSDGDLKKAIDLYALSIETCPTAEGYTFRGCSAFVCLEYQLRHIEL